MTAQRDLRVALQTAFDRARARNPAYSLRAFSLRLGMSSSAVSEILRGRRRVTAKLGERILNRLSVPEKEVRRIVKAFEIWRERSDGVTSNVEVLAADVFASISEWQHFAILALTETSNFDSRVAVLAKRLGLKADQVDAAVARLLRLGALLKDSDGNLRPSGKSYASPDGVRNEAVARSHERNLDLARRSLSEDAVTARDFSAITMAVDPDLLPRAREMIRDFQDRLSELLESGDKRAVYKMCVQLFPLSDREKGGSRE